jgi:hypothetical protein
MLLLARMAPHNSQSKSNKKKCWRHSAAMLKPSGTVQFLPFAHGALLFGGAFPKQITDSFWFGELQTMSSSG